MGVELREEVNNKWKPKHLSNKDWMLQRIHYYTYVKYFKGHTSQHPLSFLHYHVIIWHICLECLCNWMSIQNSYGFQEKQEVCHRN